MARRIQVETDAEHVRRPFVSIAHARAERVDAIGEGVPSPGISSLFRTNSLTVRSYSRSGSWRSSLALCC